MVVYIKLGHEDEEIHNVRPSIFETSILFLFSDTTLETVRRVRPKESYNEARQPFADRKITSYIMLYITLNSRKGRIQSGSTRTTILYKD